VRTYLTVGITERLGLLIGCIRIYHIIVFRLFTIRGIMLCGLVFLMIRGNIARAARRFASSCIAGFALEGHNVVRIDRLGRRARSTGRPARGRRYFSDKGVECRRHGPTCRSLALGR
jgi:hypothetical protein